MSEASIARIMEERSGLLQQIERLQEVVAGLDLALAIIGDDGSPQRRLPWGAIKQDVLDAVTPAGASVHDVLAFGKARGRELNRQTISSLLSRLAREKVFSYRDGKYYVNKS